MNTPLIREVIGNNPDIENLIRQDEIQSAILELNGCHAFLALIANCESKRVIPNPHPLISDQDKRYFHLRAGRIKMSLGGRGLTRDEINMLTEVPPDELWTVVHSLFA